MCKYKRLFHGAMEELYDSNVEIDMLKNRLKKYQELLNKFKDNHTEINELLTQEEIEYGPFKY